MCIAIYNNEDLLTKKTLSNCWTANDDGAGMLWVQDGELQTFKELNSFKSFWRKYKEIREITDKVVLHFRIRTHGKVDINNIHPFVVDETVAFVHNGVISGFSDHTSAYSDTWHFNEFLKGMPKNFIKSDACVELISEYIGSYNKLVFLGSDNEVTIVNENAGIWDGKSWFSNNSYKDASLRYYGHKLATPSSSTTKAISPYANYSKFDDDYYDALDEEGWNGSFGVTANTDREGVCIDCGLELMHGYGDNIEEGLCNMCNAHSNYMKSYQKTYLD